MSTKDERDAEGRLPGAPAWDGDLAALSPAGLAEHERGLMAQIANLTVKYHVLDSPRWKVETPESRQRNGFDRWVARLVDVRNQRSQREDQVGGIGPYTDLLETNAWNQPWKEQTHG
jgi:hypothetical protein